jgi:hypothetical protein
MIEASNFNKYNKSKFQKKNTSEWLIEIFRKKNFRDKQFGEKIVQIRGKAV